MKYMREFSFSVMLAGMFFVLCCITTSAYALSDDEAIFRIDPPDWPQPYPVLYPSLLPLDPLDIIGGGGQINLEDIDIEAKLMLLPEQPRFNGVPPILWINPPWPQREPWYQPLIRDRQHMPTDDDGQIILEYLLPPDREILPYPPRFNGAPPIDLTGSIFKPGGGFNTSLLDLGVHYEDQISSLSTFSSVNVVPEPATLLLLGTGALTLRKRKRA